MKIYIKMIQIITLLFIMLNPLILSSSKFNTDILIYLLFIIQFIGFLIFKSERKRIFNLLKTIYSQRILFSLIILNIILYISTIVAYDKRLSIAHSIRFSLYIFIFYTISYICISKYNIRLFINSFLITNLIITYYSIIEIKELYSTGLIISRSNRVASLLENSNNLGIFSLMCLFISLMLLIDTKNVVLKIFYGIIFAFCSFNIIVCQSRNAILGIIIGVVIITLFYNKKLLYLYVLSPLLLLIPQIRILALNLLSLTPDSSRYKIWKTTILMIKDHPFFGIGYENYSSLYIDYVNKSKETLTTIEGYGWIAQHPHNMFLKFQVEAGILGSVSLVVFLIITSIILFKHIRNRNIKINKLILSIFIVFVTFNLLNVFDCYYSTQKLSTAIFIILGFGVSLINIYDKNYISNYN